MKVNTVPLSKIVSALESGGRPPGGIVAGEGEVFSLGGEHLNEYGGFDLSNKRFIPRAFYEQMKRGVVQPRDILIVKDGATTGKVSYVGENLPYSPCAINEHLFRLAVDDKVADSAYVFYYLLSPKGNREILQDFHGATVGGISQRFGEKVYVPLPPLPEQKRIAAILAKADRLRRLRRYARELSDTYLQSVFLEMFGDPVTNPMGWEVLPLTSLSEGINYGVTAPASTKPVGPKFLRITDIQQGMVEWENVPYCEISEKDTRNSALDNGDIVFARTGATTGKSFLIQDCPKDAVFASYLIRVKPGARIDPFYLFGYFQSPAYWLQISSSASGSAQSGVNATKLGQLKVPVPPLPRQQEFAHVAREFERLRSQQREAERQAEHLFQTLLYRAFLGEV